MKLITWKLSVFCECEADRILSRKWNKNCDAIQQWPRGQVWNLSHSATQVNTMAHAFYCYGYLKMVITVASTLHTVPWWKSCTTSIMYTSESSNEASLNLNNTLSWLTNTSINCVITSSCRWFILVHWPEEHTTLIISKRTIMDPSSLSVGERCMIKCGKQTFSGCIAGIGELQHKLSCTLDKVVWKMATPFNLLCIQCLHLHVNV